MPFGQSVLIKGTVLTVLQGLGFPTQGAATLARAAGWISAVLSSDMHSQLGAELYDLAISDPDTASQVFDLIASDLYSGEDLVEAVSSSLSQISH